MPEIITRANAMAAGLTQYYSGKPCPQGHVAERYVSSGNCVECQCEKARQQAANPEKQREYDRRWRAANSEKRREGNWKKHGIHSAIDTKQFLTWPEFTTQLEAQGGCCANPFCHTPLDPYSRNACADHCHNTKVFRAVLCQHCNHAEGVIVGMSDAQLTWFRNLASEHEALHLWSVCR